MCSFFVSFAVACLPGAPAVRGGPWVVFVFVSFAFVCLLGLCWWGASRLLLGGRLSSVCRRLAALGPPRPCLSACLACLSSSSSSFSPFSLACLPFCSLSPMAGGAARYGHHASPPCAADAASSLSRQDIQPHVVPPRRSPWTLGVGDLHLRVPAGEKYCSGEPLTPILRCVECPPEFCGRLNS